MAESAAGGFNLGYESADHPSNDKAGEIVGSGAIADLVQRVVLNGEDADAVNALRSSVMRLSRRLKHQRVDESLSPTEMSVLGTLARCGTATPGELARKEHVQPPSMTRIVALLEAKGLVRQEPHPEDRRQKVVTQTEEAEAMLEESRSKRNAWLASLAAELDEEEWAKVRAAAPEVTSVGNGGATNDVAANGRTVPGPVRRAGSAGRVAPGLVRPAAPRAPARERSDPAARRGFGRVPGIGAEGVLAGRLRGGLHVGLIIDGCVAAPAEPVPIAAHNASWCGRAPSCRAAG